MKTLLAAAALMLLTATAQAADQWHVTEESNMCRLHTGSLATGVIAFTFINGKNLSLQLFKDKFKFHSNRMASLRDAPWLTRIKAHFIGNNSRTDHGEATTRPWDWWLEGFAEEQFNIVLGQGSLDAPVLFKYLNNYLPGIKYAGHISVKFLDGSPAWTVSTPEPSVYDQWSACLIKHGKIQKTSIDHFADCREEDARRDGYPNCHVWSEHVKPISQCQNCRPLGASQ